MKLALIKKLKREQTLTKNKMIPAQSNYSAAHVSGNFFERNAAREKYLLELDGFLTATEQLSAAQAKLLKNDNFWELINKTRIDPSRILSQSELEILASNPLYQNIYKLTLRADELYKSAIQPAGRGLKKVSDYWTGEERIFTHAFFENGIRKKAQRVFDDIGKPIIRFAAPIPLPKGQTPTGVIFRKLWNNPHYAPTTSELGVLRKYQAEEKFFRKQKFMLANPNWTKFRKLISQTVTAAKYATYAAAANYMYQQIKGGLLNYEEFTTDPKYKLQPGQVQIINETVPFPHTAIRIGDKVYSYGVTHMTSRPVNEYLKLQEIQALLKKDNNTNNEGSLKTSSATASENAKGFSRNIGLTLPRSVQVITLNLSVDERNKLKRYLELQIGKKYANTTLVNDCTTMIMRALSINTSVNVSKIIDASPSQTAMYFAAEKTAGNTKVGPIYQVSLEEADNKHTHLLRNTWINIIESKLFIDLFYLNQPHRLYIDHSLSDEELQYHEPAMQEAMRSIEEDAKKLIIDDPFIQLWEIHKITRLEEETHAGLDVISRRNVAINIITRHFDNEISEAQAIFDSPETSFTDILLYGARLEELKRKKKTLILRLQKLQ